VAIKSYILRL